jgi:two-component system chemotaxis sensor kinase CheA
VEELFASLAKDFVDESAPIAQEVGGLLLKLEAAWDAGDDGKQLLRAIRGGLHTIKGNSAMMGLSPIERVAHALEDVCAQIETIRGDKRGGLAQCLLEGCDLLVALIQSALAGQVDAKPADAFLLRAGQADEAAARSPREVAVSAEIPGGESAGLSP